MLALKICLTGGPCGGKSTALSKIEQTLTDKGYKVFVIEETATRYINAGIKPFGDDAISRLEFENMILKVQITEEQAFERTANLLDKKCIILCDRGIFDIKSFISNEEFDYLLNKNNLSKIKLMDSYNMVINLNTVAKGKPELYTLDNNTARSEGVKEAIIRDDKCLDAWSFHQNLKIIDNSTNFEEKIDKVINEINNYLGIEKRHDKKYLVELTEEFDTFIKEKELVKVDIKQTYLKTDKDYEIRLRKRTVDNNSTYYITVKKNNYDVQKIVTEELISKEEYERILESSKIINEVGKQRISFVHDNKFYKLDLFKDGLCILETDKKINVPPCIKIIKDVTSIDNYYNVNIKSNKKSKVLK